MLFESYLGRSTELLPKARGAYSRRVAGRGRAAARPDEHHDDAPPPPTPPPPEITHLSFLAPPTASLEPELEIETEQIETDFNGPAPVMSYSEELPEEVPLSEFEDDFRMNCRMNGGVGRALAHSTWTSGGGEPTIRTTAVVVDHPEQASAGDGGLTRRYFGAAAAQSQL